MVLTIKKTTSKQKHNKRLANGDCSSSIFVGEQRSHSAPATMLSGCKERRRALGVANRYNHTQTQQSKCINKTIKQQTTCSAIRKSPTQQNKGKKCSRTQTHLDWLRRQAERLRRKHRLQAHNDTAPFCVKSRKAQNNQLERELHCEARQSTNRPRRSSSSMLRPGTLASRARTRSAPSRFDAALTSNGTKELILVRALWNAAKKRKTMESFEGRRKWNLEGFSISHWKNRFEKKGCNFLMVVLMIQ